jgi:hypothetical protein
MQVVGGTIWPPTVQQLKDALMRLTGSDASTAAVLQVTLSSHLEALAMLIIMRRSTPVTLTRQLATQQPR